MLVQRVGVIMGNYGDEHRSVIFPSTSHLLTIRSQQLSPVASGNRPYFLALETFPFVCPGARQSRCILGTGAGEPAVRHRDEEPAAAGAVEEAAAG